MVIIQISCLVWMLIIYCGHEMCVNARDLCIQTRFRSQGEAGGGGLGQVLSVHYPVVKSFLINTLLCLQTL